MLVEDKTKTVQALWKYNVFPKRRDLRLFEALSCQLEFFTLR